MAGLENLGWDRPLGWLAAGLVALGVGYGLGMLGLSRHSPRHRTTGAALARAASLLAPRTSGIPAPRAGTAPTGTLVSEFVVAGLALLLVAPGFALLYFLQQRRMLTAADSDADLRLAAQLQQAVPGRPATATAPASAAARLATAAVFAVLAVKAIRNVFSPSRRP